MDVQVITDSALFADVVASFLESDPFTTNVIGVHLAGILGGLRSQHADDMWVAVVDDGRVVGVAMHTPPRRLFLSRMPAAAASALAETLSTQGDAVPGVNGEASAATAFAETWTTRTGQASPIEVSMRMYHLGRLVVPTGVPGTARPARHDDAEVVKEWFRAFHAEAVPHDPADDAAEVAERRLLGGRLRLWTDRGQPVSLACHSTAANGVARIGPVYTPETQRRRGYGAAITAAATQVALDAGAAQVVLYADLANPTSNAIYQAIGYVPDHDAQERRFVRNDSPAART